MLKFDFLDRHYTLIEIVQQVATRYIIQHLSAERIQAAAISTNATLCFPHNINSWLNWKWQSLLVQKWSRKKEAKKQVLHLLMQWNLIPNTLPQCISLDIKLFYFFSAKEFSIAYWLIKKLISNLILSEVSHISHIYSGETKTWKIGISRSCFNKF